MINNTNNDFISAPLLDQKIAKKIVKYANGKTEKLVQSEPFQQHLASAHNINRRNRVIEIEHSNLSLGKLLGQGSFASVFEVESCKYEQPSLVSSSLPTDDDENIENYVASTNSKIYISPDTSVIKLLKPSLLEKPSLYAACVADIAKETTILSCLQHPNIIQLQAVASVGIQGYVNGRNDSYFMVLERVELSLDDQIKDWYKTGWSNYKRKQSLPERLGVAVQVASGIQYLHSHCILHRDLKPDNIGIDKLGNAKIFDFDVAKVLPDSTHTSTWQMTKKVGTRRYMAPEVGLGQPYNISADIYSFALILYHLLKLEQPYPHLEPNDMLEHVYLGGERPIPSKSWPVEIQTLLQASWHSDITNRPTANYIYNVLQREHYHKMKKPLMEKLNFNKSKTTSNGTIISTSQNKIQPTTPNKLSQFLCWGTRNAQTVLASKSKTINENNKKTNNSKQVRHDAQNVDATTESEYFEQ